MNTELALSFVNPLARRRARASPLSYDRMKISGMSKVTATCWSVSVFNYPVRRNRKPMLRLATDSNRLSR